MANSAIYIPNQSGTPNIRNGDIQLKNDLQMAISYADVKTILIACQSRNADMTKWLSVVSVGDHIHIVRRGVAGNFGLYAISSIRGPIADPGVNHFELSVTLLAGVTTIVEGQEHDVGYCIKGDTGAQGAQGGQGLQGLQGLQGIQGLKGNQGIQGIAGPQGPQGDTGPQWTSGTSRRIKVIRVFKVL